MLGMLADVNVQGYYLESNKRTIATNRGSMSRGNSADTTF